MTSRKSPHDKYSPVIERDEQGRVRKITYPGGDKCRTFEYDGIGNLVRIETTAEQVVRILVRQDDKWYFDLDGILASASYTIRVSKDGEYSRQVVPGGVWRTELPDGRILQETKRFGNCYVGEDAHGKLVRICRGDGTVVEAGTDKNVALHTNGNTFVHTPDGATSIIRGDGAVIVETAESAKHTFDAQGRITAVTYPNQTRERRFSYRPNSDQITKIVIAEKDRATRVYTLQKPGVWAVCDQKGRRLGTWRGEVLLASDGTYLLKADNGPAAPTKWRAYLSDGSKM